MALCGQMDHTRHLLFFHERKDSVEIAYVCLHKPVVGFILDVLEVRQVTGIGQLIHIDDLVVRVFVDEQTHHMTSDKAGAAGDDDRFHYN